MAEPLRIALAGLGTVGAGVIRLLDANAAGQKVWRLRVVPFPISRVA